MPVPPRDSLRSPGIQHGVPGARGSHGGHDQHGSIPGVSRTVKRAPGVPWA